MPHETKRAVDRKAPAAITHCACCGAEVPAPEEAAAATTQPDAAGKVAA